MLSLELLIGISLIFFGACVGSFLNVVIYRVPEGLSVVHPPSRCPGCESKLKSYDNVPVLGWLWLGGKCRTCKMKISVQYPLIELLTMLAFVGLYAAYFFTTLRPAFATAGIGLAWPVVVTQLVLLACMIAATVIDARLFIIPLGITWTAAATAAVLHPLAAGLGWTPLTYATQNTQWEELLPSVDGPWVGLALGAAAGWVVALLLLRRGVLPQSFADEPELPEGADPNDPANFFVHPHPRREVLKELLFLVWPVVGAAGGWLLWSAIVASRRTSDPAMWIAGAPPPIDPPDWLTAFAGVAFGFLVGAAVVWFTRILGTLMFRKEAMGLGDVHLMAAVGAVIGWRDVTLAFFVAPFLGLLGTALIAGASAFRKGGVPAIPYGPYLCAASVLVMLFRVPIYRSLFPAFD